MRTLWHSLRPLAARPYRWVCDRLWSYQPPDFPAIWRDQCQHWYIDTIEKQGDRLDIAGWAPFPDELKAHVAWTWNGHPFDRVRRDLPRPDLLEAMPDVPNTANSGFHATTTIPNDVTFPDRVIEFACIDQRTGANPGPSYRSQRFLLDNNDPMPRTQQRVRVINDPSESSFRDGGYRTFCDFETFLRETTGKGYRDHQRILDWGCGCGRITRYFRSFAPSCEIFGADIDPENIAFCQEHFSFAQFEVLPLMPPSVFATGMFDLVIGISIFTHLSEEVQFAWLDELRRITRPGATLLITFHGASALLYRRLPESMLRILHRRGIIEFEYGGYDAEVGDPDYYRSTFHTNGYIMKQWSRYFDIQMIVPCGQSVQDLVVMRRR